MKKRLNTLVLALVILMSCVIPGSASLVSDSDYWTELDQIGYYDLDLKHGEYILVYYRTSCGYSKRWIPQFQTYAEYNHIPVYGIDIDYTGISSKTGGGVPVVVRYQDGKREFWTDVRSLEAFHEAVGGTLESNQGDFLIRGGQLMGYTGTDTDLVLPDGIVAIGEGCFQDNKTLHSVVIPEGVRTIGKRAFAGCEALCEVDLPSTLTKIDDVAFNSCSHLRTMTFRGGRPEFGSLSPLGSNPFAAVLPQGDSSWNDLDSLRTQFPEVNWGGLPGQRYLVPDRSVIDDGSMSDWAAPMIHEALAYDLIPIYNSRYWNQGMKLHWCDQPISREKFCKLAMRLVETQTGLYPYRYMEGLEASPFSDVELKWDQEILAAYRLGLVSGKSADTFDPRGQITRQEAACMLRRTAQYLGLIGGEQAQTFADKDSIAPWASEAVDFVSSLGIMSGTGSGFSPQGTYTTEQAYCTFLRLYQLVTA